MLKVYLDVCCLSRLTDDQSQARIRGEAEAIEQILRLMRTGEGEWITSPAVSAEASRNPDLERCRDAEMTLNGASRSVALDDVVISRAKELEEAGYDAFDALHLACAE